MGLDKLRAAGKVFARRLPRYRESPADLLHLLVKRPAILTAVGTYETALLISGRIDSRLKSLAALKTSSLVGCPF
jgi:alkylhydroperoxidase family enzyme